MGTTSEVGVKLELVRVWRQFTTAKQASTGVAKGRGLHVREICEPV